MWDATGRTQGLLWGRDPLCRQDSEGTGAQAPRHPHRRFPGTFTGHPPYSVRKIRDLGMETREIPTNPYSAGVLGTVDQGKAVGATSWRGGLPAIHLVSTPDPNPGCAPRREVAAPVMCTPFVQCMVCEVGVQPTLASGGMLASALLAAVLCTAVAKRFLATAVE